jgi:hypothetical protein
MSDAEGLNNRRVVTGGALGALSPGDRRLAYVKAETVPPDREARPLMVFDFSSGREIELPEEAIMVDGWTDDARGLFAIRRVDWSSTRGTEIMRRWRLDLGTLRWDPLKPPPQPATKPSYFRLDFGPEGEAIFGAFVNTNTAPDLVLTVEAPFQTVDWSTTLLGATPMREVRLPDGVWVANRAGTYKRYLGISAVRDVQASPTGDRLAWGDGNRTFVATLVRGVNPRMRYRIGLGRDVGLVPGDLLYVFPRKVNPLNERVVGYMDEAIRAIFVVQEVGADSAVASPAIEIMTPTPNDVVVAAPEVWSSYRSFETRTITAVVPNSPASLLGGRSDEVIQFIHDRKPTGRLLHLLQSSRDVADTRKAAEAAGRLHDISVAPELMEYVPTKRTGSRNRALLPTAIWALGEMRYMPALDAIYGFCESIARPTPSEVQGRVGADPERAKLRVICRESVTKLRIAEATGGGTRGGTVNIAGAWRGEGTDNTGPGTMMLELTEREGHVEGKIFGTDMKTGHTLEGTVDARREGPVLRGTFVFKYVISLIQRCTVELTFTAQGAESVMSGIYSGHNSCGGPVTDGRFELRKR